MELHTLRGRGVTLRRRGSYTHSEGARVTHRRCGVTLKRCGSDTHSEPSQRSGFAFPHIYNLSGFSPSLFINVCKNIKSPCILHQKLCQLLCFFLFIKTFQAVKTFYLLMRESGKINDRERDPPPRLLLTTHSRRAPCCMYFNFPVRVQ